MERAEKAAIYRDDADDNTDFHRISSVDLDKIYVASKNKGVASELRFLIMISTGMRVGGVSNLKTDHVVSYSNGKLHVRSTAKTMEKGHKWFRFSLIPRVQELVAIWISKLRPASSSPYMFPGTTGGSIATSTIRSTFTTACAAAGLVGIQFHPHALRHSYAYILLQQGNTPEIVSKLLNHESVKTTQDFYLKENAEQVVQRANIPWLAASKKKPEALPVFLEDTTRTDKRKRLAEKTLQKKKLKLSSLAMFMPMCAVDDTDGAM
jgi:integrase